MGASFEDQLLQIIEQDDVSTFEQYFPSENTVLTEVNASPAKSVNMHLLCGNASQPILFVVILKQANKILDYLLHHFTNTAENSTSLQLNYVNSIHANALHMAASVNNVEAAMMLLEHPKFSKKNERDFYGAHAIHIAASQNYCDLVSMLVTMCNMDVNLRKGQSGKTPLHIAMENNHTEMVTLLLDQLDANFKARDSDQMPALMRIACNSQYENYKSSFLYSMLTRDVEFVYSVKDQQKQNMIHKCAMSGNLKFLRMLALVIPTPLYSTLVNEKDANQYTPLHYACSNMNVEVVETLLLMGANVLETDAKGNTPCHTLALMPFKKNLRRNGSLICNLLLNSSQGKELLVAKNNSQETVEKVLQNCNYFKPAFSLTTRRPSSLPNLKERRKSKKQVFSSAMN